MSSDRLRRVGYVVKMFPRISETFVLNEILELERQGVEVVIFSAKKPNEGRFHPQLARLKARVFYLDDLDLKKWSTWLAREWSTLAPYQGRLWEALSTALAAGDSGRIDLLWQSAWIVAQVEKLGIEHLHAHFASLPSTLAYLAHQISGVSYTFTAHAKDIYVYTNNEHLLNEKVRTASRVITVTKFNRDYLESTYPDLPEHRIKVIHNGIDLELFRPDTEGSRETNLILAVGRLVPKKGFDILLAALANLKAESDSFTCRIVGEGSERAVLEGLCLRLGLESYVRFDGALHQEEVRSLMNRATLLALPCVVAEDGNVDALPTVLLEALACGLPVVSTSVSGIPEIVDHQTNGLLCEPGDVAGLAGHIQRLLGDPGLRMEIARQGRIKAEASFDLSRNVRSLREEFAQAVDRVQAVADPKLSPLAEVHDGS